jgi:bacillithiol system protein YtxJ
MGLFDKLFSGSNEPKQEDATPWIDLNTLEQLDMIKESSKTKTQLIFKHSTRCGISRMVMSQFKKDYQLSENEADLYYLDLLNFKEISGAIAETFSVMHESPQLLIIKNGIVVAHKSHGGINELGLQKFV